MIMMLDIYSPKKYDNRQKKDCAERAEYYLTSDDVD
jgi:hypothetical protein